MKNIKIYHLITYAVVTLTYLLIYSAYNTPQLYENLSESNLISYANLSENDQIKIIGLSQDSVKIVTDFADSTKIFLTELDPQIYTTFQSISSNTAEVAERLFLVKRLILGLYLFLISYLLFTSKFNFNMSFQKILFEACKFSLLFTVFAISGLLVTQMVLGTIRSPFQMLQILLGEFVEVLKYGVIYSVLISLFLFFHPHNIARQQKKN